MKSLNEPSSVGAKYAAPPGLDFILVCGAAEMPRLRRWVGSVRGKTKLKL
jgi:hypothetical protein